MPKRNRPCPHPTPKIPASRRRRCPCPSSFAPPPRASAGPAPSPAPSWPSSSLCECCIDCFSSAATIVSVPHSAARRRLLGVVTHPARPLLLSPSGGHSQAVDSLLWPTSPWCAGTASARAGRRSWCWVRCARARPASGWRRCGPASLRCCPSHSASSCWREVRPTAFGVRAWEFRERLPADGLAAVALQLLPLSCQLPCCRHPSQPSQAPSLPCCPSPACRYVWA